MSEGKEGQPIQESNSSSDDARRNREDRERNGRDERGLSLDQYSLAADLLREETRPGIGELGHVLVTMWLLSQTGTHGGTEVSNWGVSSLISAMSVRTMMDGFVGSSRSFIEKTLNNVSSSVDSQLTDLKSDMYKTYHPYLGSALAKEALYELKGGEEYKFDPFEELSEDEAGAFTWYKKEVDQVSYRAKKCGSLGEALNKQIASKLGCVRFECLDKSGLLDSEPLELKAKVQKRLEEFRVKEIKANKRVAIESMAPDFTGESSKEWMSLIIGFLGATSVFDSCHQWLTNQSDLEPISRMWEAQGRMVEIHPSYLKEMSERYPSFEKAFRGIAALGSGKYALGMNGEIYPSGAYGLGYIEKSTGRVVDIEVACDIGKDGKKTLKNGFEWLKKNQIWVDGGKVDVSASKDKNGEEIVDVLEKRSDGSRKTVIQGGKAVISGTEVEIYLRNILYNSGSKDSDVNQFIEKVTEFTKVAIGGDKFDVDLGVALARDFYESTMLSNWNGIPRDSKGRPYYVEYKGTANSPERDYSTISSDPESKAVKTGVPLCGWDEASLYPYWVGDWGKLTQTRIKQLAELTKGRSHGLYALLPYLPESLAKPMLSVVRNVDKSGFDKNGKFNYDILDIVNGDVKMGEVFDEMKSVERFKTFWLGIARGIAVYEFVSSYFIGDKDVTKADQDLLTMMMQPRNFEKITKMIDLSVLYVDPLEAARLRVNIVTAALESVAKEFYNNEFLTMSVPGALVTGGADGRFLEFLDTVKSFDYIKKNKSGLAMSLRQLAISRFVGDETDVIKILDHILKYSKGKGELGFTRDEFLAVFGEGNSVGEKQKSIEGRIWGLREDRRSKIVGK